MLLGILADISHGFHRLYGVFAGGGLAGEHHSAAAVIHGVGHVRDFCPGGPGVLDHGFQHFRCGDDPLAQHTAGGGQALLDGGHLYKGNFHAQVTPGDHHAVGHLANLLDVIHTGAVFNFGNQVDIFTAICHQEALQFFHISLGGDKGGRHEIHLVLDAEEQILLVLLTEVGAGHDLIGEAHALTVGEHTAHQNLGDYIGALNTGDLTDHQAVIDQNPVTHGEVFGEFLIIDADPGLVTLHLIGGENKGVALG